MLPGFEEVTLCEILRTCPTLSFVLRNWFSDFMELTVVLNCFAIFHNESPFLTTYSVRFPLPLDVDVDEAELPGVYFFPRRSGR